MRLPAGSLDQLLQGDAAGPFQQIEDLGRFAAGAGRSSFLGAGGLVGRLAFGRCRSGGRLAPRGFAVAFSDAVLVCAGSVGVVILSGLLLRGSRRVTTLLPLFGATSKLFLEKLLE